ncbi:hypothetical protein CIK05_14000 [Bdellovibrio sp. qaytius]|nr:hypothetical protein CIK05_14000 [Bdellovibrio sp. qaytius]
MLKDLIRVGPPQGTIDDLDLKVPKALDHGMKNDFEKELKAAKEGLKEKDQPKAEKQNDQRKDSDQVSKKSSGGIKKKMARAKDDKSDAEKPETDIKAKGVIQPQAIEQKISNVMVSKEGEVEIADSEENLQKIATEQQPIANIQNIKTQVLAEVTAAIDGEALSAEAQAQVAASQVQAQPQFQYMTSAEKAVLADINGEAMSQDAVQVAPEGQLETKLLQPELGDQKLLKTPALEGQAQQQPQLSLVKPMQDAKVQTEEETAVDAKSQSTAPTLESKVYDILSKEVAKPADLKLQQQDVAQNTEKPQALNQTNAVLAKSSADNEKQKGQGDKENSSGERGGQQQGLAKFDGSNDLAAQVSALHTGQRSFQSHIGTTEAAAGAAATAKPNGDTDAMKDANVREVMNQAKYLVTAGGGEMTVKMTPEGMGEVNLKVMLDNGKINIEMNAQDKSVKKMLEDNLSDLKSSLATHQMRVEHVKINNVTAVDTNNQAQFQSDANSSNSSFQNRQQQEMNFQNFANSNSGRGREQGSSAYQTSQQQSVQTPIAKSAQGRAAYVAANKGSSVNVVA